jgi:anti-sigma B factor antagonist
MEVHITEYKHCDVIKVTGRIDSSTASQLGEKVNEIQSKGRYKLVFDMTNVDFISSSGLWVLVNAQKASKRYNRGEVVLACVPDKIFGAFELAGFIPFFKVFDNVTAAVGNF